MVDLNAIQAEIDLQDSLIEATQNVRYFKPLMQKIVESRKNKKIKDVSLGEEGKSGLACVAKHFTICLTQAALERNLLRQGREPDLNEECLVTYEDVSKIPWSDPRLGFVKRAVPKILTYEEALRARKKKELKDDKELTFEPMVSVTTKSLPKPDIKVAVELKQNIKSEISLENKVLKGLKDLKTRSPVASRKAMQPKIVNSKNSPKNTSGKKIKQAKISSFFSPTKARTEI